jgi:hypothetical protein
MPRPVVAPGHAVWLLPAPRRKPTDGTEVSAMEEERIVVDEGKGSDWEEEGPTGTGGRRSKGAAAEGRERRPLGCLWLRQDFLGPLLSAT